MNKLPSNLFRPEAIRFHQQQFNPPPHFTGARRAIWPWLTGAILTALAIMGLLQLTYSQSYRVSGKIDNHNVHIIRSNINGYVSAIFVSEGELVQAGQPVIRITNQNGSREHAARIVEIARQITLKQQRLDLLTQTQVVTQQKHDLKIKALITKNQLQSRRISLQARKRHQLLLISKDTRALLANKFASRREWQRQSQDVLDADLLLLKLHQQQQDISRYRLESVTLLTEAQLKLKQNINQELQNVSLLRERQSTLESGLRTILNAPTAGAIGHHHISLYSQITAGTALLNLHKTHQPYSATLFIPVKLREHLSHGDPIYLRLDRNGKNEQPLLKSRISHIDEAAIAIQTGNGNQTNTYVNLVRVTFNKKTIASADASLTLSPGMPLQALIKLTEKTLLVHLGDFINTLFEA
jgi:membrane fusion protein